MAPCILGWVFGPPPLPSGNNRGRWSKTDRSKDTKENRVNHFWTSPKIAVQKWSLPSGNNREPCICHSNLWGFGVLIKSRDDHDQILSILSFLKVRRGANDIHPRPIFCGPLLQNPKRRHPENPESSEPPPGLAAYRFRLCMPLRVL